MARTAGAGSLILFWSIGCGNAPGDADATFRHRDSGGIVIAENPEVMPAGLEHWTVDPEPLIDIGAENRGPDYLLMNANSVHRLSSGEYLVVEGNPDFSFRVFDSKGQFVKRFGGRGSGPGEFSQVDLALGKNDSIFVFDVQQRRATSVDKLGRIGSVVSIAHSPAFGSPTIVGRTSDGAWIARRGGGSAFNRRESGFWRDTVGLIRVDIEKLSVTQIGLYPDQKIVSIVAGRSQTFTNAPFTPSLQAVTHDSLIYVGTQDRYEIMVLDSEGKTRRLIRWLRPLRPVTEEIISKLEADGSPRYPKHFPAFGAMRADKDGNLWVQEYEDPLMEDTVTRWAIFDRVGRLKATAELPSRGLWITEIGSGDVVGIASDSNDVLHVRRHRLTRKVQP